MLTEGGNGGDRGVEHEFVYVLDDFETGAVGHPHIGQDEGIVVVVKLVFGIFYADGGLHAQTHLHQRHFHQVADVCLVIDDQYWVLQLTHCVLSVKLVRIRSFRGGNGVDPYWRVLVRGQRI